MPRATHREELDMCSSRVMRWAQNALRCRVRHGVEMGIADGTRKGRRAGDVRATGWPLWPSGSRCDVMWCGAVRCGARVGGYGGGGISSYVLPSVPSRAPAPYRDLAPADRPGWAHRRRRKDSQTMERMGQHSTG